MPDKGSKIISTFGSRITSMVSVSLVLILLGLAAMLAVAASSLGDDLQGSLGFTARLERGLPDDQAAAVAERMALDRGVREVAFLSADSILAFEAAAVGGLALEPGVNPYCAEIEVKVKPEYASADSIAAIAAACAAIDGVQEVISASEVIEGVDRTLSRLRLVLTVLGVVLLVISIILINNTVSLSIYSRRFSIHTMRLVGATAGFIRRPFVSAGILNGFLAGMAASAVLCAVRAWAAGADPAVDSALSWVATGVICALAVVCGVLLCGLTSLFATNRYLAKSYDEMFLK